VYREYRGGRLRRLSRCANRSEESGIWVTCVMGVFSGLAYVKVVQVISGCLVRVVYVWLAKVLNRCDSEWHFEGF